MSSSPPSSSSLSSSFHTFYIKINSRNYDTALDDSNSHYLKRWCHLEVQVPGLCLPRPWRLAGEDELGEAELPLRDWDVEHHARLSPPALALRPLLEQGSIFVNWIVKKMIKLDTFPLLVSGLYQTIFLRSAGGCPELSTCTALPGCWSPGGQGQSRPRLKMLE